MNTVFIGFDPVEEVAYHTLVSSIMKHASRPVRIVPIDQRSLKGIYHREYDPKQTNEFTYTRFLTPYLSEFKDWSLFMDSDMLVRDDINKLFDLADEKYKVMCVQHPDYVSKVTTKWHGKLQSNYPKKNWSSLMLFNNAECRALSPVKVNMAGAGYLHRMDWVRDLHHDKIEDYVGNLPKEWNHLVGEQEPNPEAKIAHFTLGTPCFDRFQGCEFADEWLNQRAEMEYFLPEIEQSA